MTVGPDSPYDEVLAMLLPDPLPDWRQVKEGDDGRRLTWDSAAGLWLTDEELVTNWRARERYRQIVGPDYYDTAALNRAEGAPNPQGTKSPYGDHRSGSGYGLKRDPGAAGKNRGHK